MPLCAQAVETLEALHAAGFVGVRFNPYLFPDGMDSDVGRALYAKAGELGMPVGVMAFGGFPAQVQGRVGSGRSTRSRAHHPALPSLLPPCHPSSKPSSPPTSLTLIPHPTVPQLSAIKALLDHSAKTSLIIDHFGFYRQVTSQGAHPKAHIPRSISQGAYPKAHIPRPHTNMIT